MNITLTGDMNKLFDDQKFRVISKDIMKRFGDIALRNGVSLAKSMAPVGSASGNKPDPHPGQMKEAIYGDMTMFPERVRVIIAIANPPVDYAKPVIYGSRRHKPNNFMKRALSATYKILKKELKGGQGMGPDYFATRNERSLKSEG